MLSKHVKHVKLGLQTTSVCDVREQMTLLGGVSTGLVSDKGEEAGYGSIHLKCYEASKRTLFYQCYRPPTNVCGEFRLYISRWNHFAMKLSRLSFDST